MIEPIDDLVSSIHERYLKVQETIAAAARRGGRAPDSVRVVVVTKTQPLDLIEAAIAAGVRVLGENYAEEAVEKIEALKAKNLAIEWHMVGHVQSRKAKLVAQYFDFVHSLDSLKLAQKLDRAAHEMKRRLPVLLEFNVGDEKAKHGWHAAEEGRWSGLVAEVKGIAALPNLSIRGVMTMPPLSTDPQAGRVYFRQLARLRDFLASRVPAATWDELSMGTSMDYAVAIEEGATLVRVGQAILGPRPVEESM